MRRKRSIGAEGRPAERPEDQRPREEEHHQGVEDDEHQRHQVEPDRELDPGRPDRAPARTRSSGASPRSGARGAPGPPRRGSRRRTRRSSRGRRGWGSTLPRRPVLYQGGHARVPPAGNLAGRPAVPPRAHRAVHAHLEEEACSCGRSSHVSLALLVGLAAVGQAWAFSCPNLVKGANEAIAAAEPKAGMGDDRQKARNAGMVEEAKALSRTPRPLTRPASTGCPRRRPRRRSGSPSR